jgi:hypothetical protein
VLCSVAFFDRFFFGLTAVQPPPPCCTIITAVIGMITASLHVEGSTAAEVDSLVKLLAFRCSSSITSVWFVLLVLGCGNGTLPVILSEILMKGISC